MMSHLPGSPRHLAALVAAMVLVVLAFASSAQAAEAPWGELEHFGEKGKGKGQLEHPEYAFGIDHGDGGVWVVDTKAEGKSFRLQKFMKVAGKWQAVASTAIKPQDPGGEEEDEVEGVAFDPTMERAYVLVSEVRPPLKKAGERIDQFDGAAAELFAFNTKPVGEKIEPASGTGTEGLLAGESVLEPLSNEPGHSLLEPGGITVDPVSHNVIIPGFIDRGKKAPAPEGTAAVEQVTPEGKLGSRWVDEANFFEECECVNSPVVTPSGSIYVIGELDELDELPANLSSGTLPKHVFSFDCEGCFNELLTEFPGQGPENGSQMSLGAEGNIYLRARIKLATEEDFSHAGVLVLSPTFAELGWTGGNTPASETQKCSVNESPEAPALATGKEEHTVFMLQRGSTPRIVEFGPGGTGCPTASATVPTAKSGGVEVEPVPIADRVTLSSKVTQANAESVEWNFGDGTSQTVSTRGTAVSEGPAIFSVTEVQHTFKKGGHLSISEKIHTDDLASPVIEVKRSLTVVAAPTVASEEAELGPTGLTVTLKGSVNPNGKQTECKFEYGKASEGYPTALPCTLKEPSSEQLQEVSAAITSGLTKHTEYHFRITAKNIEGTTEGKGFAFTTGPVPVVQTEAVAGTSITQTSATLSGKVNPEGATTQCHFEYGTSTSYGTSVPCPVAPGGGEAAIAESITATGLKAGTLYHFRIAATNSAGTGLGADQSFTTVAPEPPPRTGGGEGPGSSPGQTGVKGFTAVQPPPAIPIVTIATSSTSVSAGGAFTLKVTCPSTETGCSGTVTVKTLTAVLASAHVAAKKKKAILTLASGSFALGGGQAKTLTLHLSAKARGLLARVHLLRAHVGVSARDPHGATHVSSAIITLKLAKGKHH